MLTHAIAFLLGGYLIPATMWFWGIWAVEKNAPDSHTWTERFLTAFMGAILWPFSDGDFKAIDE